MDNPGRNNLIFNKLDHRGFRCGLHKAVLTRSLARPQTNPNPSCASAMETGHPRHKPATRLSSRRCLCRTRTALPFYLPTGWKPKPQRLVIPQDWRARMKWWTYPRQIDPRDGVIFLRAPREELMTTVFRTCPRGGFHAHARSGWRIARLAQWSSLHQSSFNALQARIGAQDRRRTTGRSPPSCCTYDLLNGKARISQNAPLPTVCRLKQACAAFPETHRSACRRS